MLLQNIIEAVESVGRLQRSDHIRKAVNYVKILLEKGADPNAKDEWGIGYAIHYAIWTGNMDLIRLLADHEHFNPDVDTGEACMQERSSVFPGTRMHFVRLIQAKHNVLCCMVRLLMHGASSLTVLKPQAVSSNDECNCLL